MLVLTRKALEKIQIGPDITVTVVEVRGKYVRLGIEAPKNVQVVRSELLQHPAAPVEQPAPLSHPVSPPPG
jgi:carbon storage regulator